MKWILLLSLLISCSTTKRTFQENINKRWAILEDAITQNWDQSKIVKLLGVPQKKIKDEIKEYWSYYSSKNGIQEWSISFSLKSKKVTYVGYNPTGLMDAEFTLDKILKRWKKNNCMDKKSDWYAKGHTVYQDNYYLCDGNKRIYYNRYEEVSWIKISE